MTELETAVTQIAQAALFWERWRRNQPAGRTRIEASRVQHRLNDAKELAVALLEEEHARAKDTPAQQPAKEGR